MAEALEVGSAYLNIMASARGLQRDVQKKVKGVKAPDIVAKIDAEIGALQAKAAKARQLIQSIEQSAADPQIGLDITELSVQVRLATAAYAEQEEQHAQRQLAAARTRDQAQRARDAAAQLEREREQAQRDWAVVTSGPPAEVTAKLEAAATAAVDYFAAVRSHLDRIDEVRDRAEQVGLRPPERAQYRRSPLPGFATAVLAEAKEQQALDWSWTKPPHNTSIWEGFGG